jgi:aminoglycoside 6-adenylyltransferase
MFSDFDVILVLSDIQPNEDRTWLEHFGPLLALYRDHLEPQDGLLKSGYVSHQYKNDLKIDFTLWPVEILENVATYPHLPVELDAGYRAYIPIPTAEDKYQEAVEEMAMP